MKKLLLWLWMLTKRLYKKPLYALILLALPLTTLLYREAAVKDPGGAVTVVLTQEAADPLATQLIESLPGSSQLVRWLICEDTEVGLRLLRSGKADALWVFPGELAEKIAAFTEDPDSGSFITVYERQDSVALALCRERLSSLVYPAIARQVYLTYLRQEFPELAELTDEKLLSYYDETVFNEDLFALDSNGEQGQPPSLLLSPLRGLLAVLIQLCALAAAMFYLEDQKKGTFAWVRRPWNWVPEIACQLVSVLQVALVSGVCLALCGLAGSFFRELALTGLYGLCCCGFAMVLRRLVPRLGALAVLTPILCVAMLVLCPVFFDAGQLQWLFPMGWYLQGHTIGLGIYALSCFGLTAIWKK